MKITLPGLKRLDRYIIGKFLGTYIFAVGIFVVILVTFDYVEKVDNFITNKASFSAIAFQYYLNFIPSFINQFSGLLTFIAVIFFTSKMAYNTEIVAILSSGVSFGRLMWPYAVSSMAITLFALALNLWVIPRANEPVVKFLQTYNSRDMAASQQYDAHIYRQLSPGTFIYLRNFSGDTNKANYFSIEKFEDGALVETLEAGDVTYNEETGRWTAPKYIIHRLVRQASADSVAVASADSVAVASADSVAASVDPVTVASPDREAEIPADPRANSVAADEIASGLGAEEFLRLQRLDTTINLSTMELGRLDKIIETMPIGELNSFMAEQKTKGSDMMATFEVERQSRYSYPVAIFILTLIGVSLSSRKVRGGTGLHIGLGIGLCFAYILFSRFAEEFAKGGIMPAAIAVWIPDLIFAGVAVWLYIKAPK